jgi:hypothetical protein
MKRTRRWEVGLASALCGHPLGDLAREEEAGLEVDLEHLVPRRLARVDDRPERRVHSYTRTHMTHGGDDVYRVCGVGSGLHTSVVDENVDGAVLVQRVLDEVLSVGSLGHMTHEAADRDPLVLVG